MQAVPSSAPALPTVSEHVRMFCTTFSWTFWDGLRRRGIFFGTFFFRQQLVPGTHIVSGFMSNSPDTIVEEYSSDEDNAEPVRAEIKCNTFLGAGTSGSVKGVAPESAIDGREYAVKTIKLSDAVPPAHLLAECSIHASLPPSNALVRYHFSWQDGSKLHILLERVDGELWDALTEPEARLVDESERLNWISDLLIAVDAVHASGVAHRDISPWNCFLATETAPSRRRLKLGDFGLACRAHGDIFGMTAPLGFAPLDESAIGSLYSAPELGADSGYDGTAVDIFSAGMTIFAMWHAVLVAKAKAKAWEGSANLPTAQKQSEGARRPSHDLATAASNPEEVSDAHNVWEEELTGCVERLKADGRSLPECWGATPMADLVCRMVSHDARSRPTAKECLEMLRRSGKPPQTGLARQAASRKTPWSWMSWLSGRRSSSRVQPHISTGKPRNPIGSGPKDASWSAAPLSS